MGADRTVQVDPARQTDCPRCKKLRNLHEAIKLLTEEWKFA